MDIETKITKHNNKVSELRRQISATINEQYPDKSNFQLCKITISNLSKEALSMIDLLQAQSGMVIPVQNGSIIFDIKDMLNMGQIPSQN